MAAPLYEAFMGKPAPAAVSCPDCQKKFPDLPHLHDHMGAQMAKGNGHTHCKECKKYFQEVEDLIAHVKEVHIKPTDLICPGCLRHYGSIGEIALHIEKGQCPTISMKKLEEVGEKKLRFAKELEKRHRGGFDDLDGRPSAMGSHFRPKAEATVRPNPIQLLVHERGKLGEELPLYYGQSTPLKPGKTKNSKNPASSQQTKEGADDPSQQKVSLLEDFEPDENGDLGPSLQSFLTKGIDGIYTNPWVEEKSTRDPNWVDIIPVCAPIANGLRDPNPEPVVAQKESKNSRLFTPAPKPNVQWKTGLTGGATNFNSFAALHDPKNPGWSIKRYLNPVLLQYKCPAPNCFKYFKKTGQFQNHLQWHLQDTPCEYQCPGCRRMFICLSSLFFHTESRSQRCHYRDSPTYNIFINQALGGLVDIVDQHGLGSEKVLEFAVPDQAFDDFAPPGRIGRPTEEKVVTAAWLGNKRNGQERSPVRLPNIPGLADSNVKLEFESYETAPVEIDDAFRNLPELGDKIAPEREEVTDGTPRQVDRNEAHTQAKKHTGDEVKVEIPGDLVTLSNNDAKARVASDDEVRGRTRIVNRDNIPAIERKLNALYDERRNVEQRLTKVDSVESHLPQAKSNVDKVETAVSKAKVFSKDKAMINKSSGIRHLSVSLPTAIQTGFDSSPKSTLAPEAPETRSFGQQQKHIGGRARFESIRQQDFEQDNYDTGTGYLDTKDLYIDGRKYSEKDWVIEWCGDRPLFFPRDPDNYKPIWTPINR